MEVVAGEDMRWGVYVVFAASDDLARRSLDEYGVQTDREGRFAALYRPSHLIGLELGVSVLTGGASRRGDRLRAGAERGCRQRREA